MTQIKADLPNQDQADQQDQHKPTMTQTKADLPNQDQHQADVESPEQQQQNIVARNYQLDLLAKALEKNVILCLGTGTGKTFISVLVVKELLYETRQSIAEGGKRSVFLAPTVPLAKQQANCLKKFLDAKVSCYTGSEVDLWDGSVWAAEFEVRNVLVMTPQVFCNILHANYVKMCDVNVLILDECHAATGKSPYVQIMQNHYRDLADKLRPKILGLTASVLNRKVKPEKVHKEVMELCSRLNSNLATSLDAMSFGTKPSEVIVCHNTIPKQALPILDQFPADDSESSSPPSLSPSPSSPSASSSSSSSSILGNLKVQTERLLNDVGPFGVLKVMQHRKHITEHLIEMSLAEPGTVSRYRSMTEAFVRVEAMVLQWATEVRLGRLDNVYMARPAAELPEDVRSVLVDPVEHSLSPKIHRLLEIFRVFEQRDTALCSVVFATERYTVFALWAVLMMLSRRCPSRYGYIRPGFIMGQGSMSQFADISSKVMNFVDEREPDDCDQNVLDDFRSGRLNVLIATSVIEEGVDIPQCNLIVRYKEPLNVRSYVQSRGRARARPSLYVILCAHQDYNEVESSLKEFKESELNVLKYCLSDDTDIDGADVEFALADDPDLPTLFALPDTPNQSAIITAQSARSVLQWYCDSLGVDRYKVLRPMYTFEIVSDSTNDKLYKCSVELPKESALQGVKVSGRPLESKIKAKISSALLMCARLYEAKELTENLVPKKRPRPDMYEWTDEEVSGEVKALFKGNTITQTSTITCGRSRAAQLCDRDAPELPACASIFVFRIRLEEPLQDEHYHGRVFRAEDEPLCFGILTFQRADHEACVPDFPIFTRAGREQVHVDEIKNVPVTEELWTLCKNFHKYVVTQVLRISIDVCEHRLAPLIVPVVDQSLCTTLLRRLETPAEAQPTCDSVVTIAFESETPTAEAKRRTFYVGEIFTDCEEPKVSLVKINMNIDFVNNCYLDKTKLREQTAVDIKRRFAMPARLCSVEMLSAPQWNKALSVPSCFYRLNRLLVAEELRMKLVAFGVGPPTSRWSPMSFDRVSNDSDLVRAEHKIILDELNFVPEFPHATGPSPVDIYTALSPLSTADIVDSERYEVIGDSFLKISVTLHLFGRFQTENEGHLTRERCRLVSNMNLLALAVPHRIHEAVESKKFAAKVNFLPPGCGASASGSTELKLQSYKSKVCADSIEALIGVYLEKSGATGALEFLRFLGMDLTQGVMSGSFVSRFNLGRPTPPTATTTTTHEENGMSPYPLLNQFKYTLDKVEKTLDYTFTRRDLLLEAITHQSYRHNRPMRSYERLEFLGDAVVDYLVSRYLYCNCPQLSPGDLTNARSALVCNSTFARAITRHGLHQHLFHRSPTLHKLTDTYLAALDRGVQDDMLLCDDDCDDVSCVDVPKPLGDMLESLVGAVFLDSGGDFDRVWTLVRRLIGDDVLRRYLVNIPRNPIAVLQELFPRKIRFSQPTVVESSKLVQLQMHVETGDGDEQFVVVARNKKVARVALAKKALRHFDRIRRGGSKNVGLLERYARELLL